MMSSVLERLIDSLREWCECVPGIAACAIVGSHARGEARDDSDIDVIILSTGDLLSDLSWTARFGDPVSHVFEEYGAATSIRVFYNGGMEVEFAIAHPNWAKLPIDEGTRNVVCRGMVVVYDPHGILAHLLPPTSGETADN